MYLISSSLLAFHLVSQACPHIVCVSYLPSLISLLLLLVRFCALEEVFMSYRPHGAWRTMEVLEELA
jgi:hypothetical protein